MSDKFGDHTLENSYVEKEIANQAAKAARQLAVALMLDSGIKRLNITKAAINSCGKVKVKEAVESDGSLTFTLGE